MLAQWYEVYSGFLFQGWLAVTSLVGSGQLAFLRDSNPGWGIRVARLVCVGFGFCFREGQIEVRVLCFSRDWARCRAALGAKKTAVRDALRADSE